jgi:rhodanese-related sulfurtransferase
LPPPTMVSASQLSRLVGLPDAPALIDVRTREEYAADTRVLPGAVRRDVREFAKWVDQYAPRQRVVGYCQRGLALSQGAAARLRNKGVEAESLEGGFEAWGAVDGLLARCDKLPSTYAHGHTVWVTRARPKVDRIACPWLIRRFIDPNAEFLFVAPAEVADIAQQFGATPFDIDGAFWSHRDELCTFDVMLDEFGLHSAALDRLALIVRAADTARLDLAPQAAGLLAASLGLSRMHKDDLTQLDAGLALYDSFYRWSRDAAEETHDWITQPEDRGLKETRLVVVNGQRTHAKRRHVDRS